MSLSEIINSIGVVRVARACGVNHQNVQYWRKRGLPSRQGDAERRAQIERDIARLAGMRVGEFRKMLAEEEAERKAQA